MMVHTSSKHVNELATLYNVHPKIPVVTPITFQTANFKQLLTVMYT